MWDFITIEFLLTVLCAIIEDSAVSFEHKEDTLYNLSICVFLLTAGQNIWAEKQKRDKTAEIHSTCTETDYAGKH